MTDFPEDKKIELPSLLPFLMNMALASALGAMMAGWLGAVLGGALLMAVFAFIWLISFLRSRKMKLKRIAELLWRLARPLIGIIVLPVVLILTAVVVGITYVWQRGERFIGIPSVSVIAPITTAARRGRRFLLGFFTPRNLPGTALNFLLLLTLGCVAIGIEVAFYAALAAVPIVILTLAMVALESSNEPEQD